MRPAEPSTKGLFPSAVQKRRQQQYAAFDGSPITRHTLDPLTREPLTRTGTVAYLGSLVGKPFEARYKDGSVELLDFRQLRACLEPAKEVVPQATAAPTRRSPRRAALVVETGGAELPERWDLSNLEELRKALGLLMPGPEPAARLLGVFTNRAAGGVEHLQGLDRAHAGGHESAAALAVGVKSLSVWI